MKNWLKKAIKQLRKSQGSVAEGNYAPVVIGVDTGKEESYSATVVRQGDRLTQVVLGDDFWDSFWDSYIDGRLNELSGFIPKPEESSENRKEVRVTISFDGSLYAEIRENLSRLHRITSHPIHVCHIRNTGDPLVMNEGEDEGDRVITRESMHRWESNFFDLPPDRLAETTELFRRQLAVAGMWRTFPTEAIAPANPPERHCCTSCKHNHDREYNGIQFFCAMHPYGWSEAGVCPDREELSQE